MHYRPLGKTGYTVSEISMGCNRLGEPNMPDRHWVDLVRRAVELGVNLFDTSESYGWGRSEEMLGQAIGNRGDILIATKVSRIRETNRHDFSSQRIVERAESSLRRLHRDCIDIYQLHSPRLEEMKHFDWLEGMARLKEAGKIRLVGVSINDVASGEWLIEEGLADVLQVPYNMLEPEVGEGVFPLAKQHGVGIMVRMPMAQGILTGKFSPDEPVPEGHRAHLAGAQMPKLIRLAEDLKPLALDWGIPLGRIALQYAISPGAVSAAIPGARTPEQLMANVEASNGVGLTEEQLVRIASIQKRWNR